MGLAISSGDLLTVVLKFINGSQGFGYNVLHYNIGTLSGPTPALATGMAAIGQAIYDNFKTEWANASSTAATFLNVSIANAFPLPRSTQIVYQPATPTVGVVTGDLMPGQDCITVLKRTAVGERWGLGRAFVPGMSEGSNNGGRLTAGAITLYAALAPKYSNQINGVLGGWSFNIYPILLNGPEGAPTARTQIITSELSNDVIKTQRRRRPGKGI